MASVGGLLFSTAALAATLSTTQAFAPPQRLTTATTTAPTSITCLFNRAERRKQKKKKSRSSVLTDDDDDDDLGFNSLSPKLPTSSPTNSEPILLGSSEAGYDYEIPESKIPIAKTTSKDLPPKPSKLDQELSGKRIEEDGILGESVTSAASVSDMPLEPGQRQPDVSTVTTDPETGIARIQQGKYVMDKVTGKAVVLSSLGPEYRLAQMFPGVPEETRDRYRFDWDTVSVEEMVMRLREACTVPLKKNDREWSGIPPHPMVSNPAVEFVTANRDYLGHRMKKTLGRLKLRAQSQFRKEEALQYRQLWKHFMLLEDHISAPFRQILLNAEGKIGPQFGNLDVASYCGGELYERTASYLVLKSMVAHWEKKYEDAKALEEIPDGDFMRQLYTGDPKRYLPDPPIIFRLDEVSRIVIMAQKMCKAFVDSPELFNDLPAEVRFVEAALSIQGGTALRQFTLEEFCPANNIDPASLREGLRRLYQQMFNMQIDPYGDLTMTLWNLCVATSVGTNDARDPYEEYIGNVRGTNYETNPGYFQTYTFDHDKNSLVRFLDSARPIDGATASNPDEISRQIKGVSLTLIVVFRSL
jgi:hypothetical protein